MPDYNSEQSLEYLAHQLAFNHFKVSSYDLEFSEHKKTLYTPRMLYQTVFDHTELGAIKILNHRNDVQTPSRNILVIGAGASYNAFEDIPLAIKAQEKILDEIIITKQVPIQYEDGAISSVYKELSFYYFIEYYKRWDKNQCDISPLTNLKENEEDPLNDIDINRYLRDELINEDSFLSGLGDKYLSELRKSRLIRSIYRVDERVDFETSLNILSNILPVAQIRRSIQKLYQVRHGPTLFYHIVAHLFKHRFIDIIINFNFDELLDQILDEELASNSYDKILSDGDCRLKKDVVQFDRLRQPLYIKPHGTASHKSSMRFTKDHYHELPIDMRNFIRGLLNSNEENLSKKLNLITVGFELKSIEFNELLNETLNKDSQIFSFIWHDQTKDDFKLEKMVSGRIADLEAIFEEEQRPTLYLIAHEDFKNIEYGKLRSTKGTHMSQFSPSLDNTFVKLYDHIYSLFGDHFKPRGIYKHIAISKIFGNRVFWNLTKYPIKHALPHWTKIDEEPCRHPKGYFHSSEYYKDRLLVEILISATNNQGKIDPYVLMDGTLGRFYEAYYHTKFQELTDEDEPKPDKERRTRREKIDEIATFNSLLRGVGLEEKRPFGKFDIRYLDIPKEFQKDPGGKADPSAIDGIIDTILKRFLRDEDGVFSPTLRRYFQYVSSPSLGVQDEFVRGLSDTFKHIFFSDNTKIQSKTRNPRYHIFERYDITDSLSTELSNKLNFYLALVEGGVNTICSCVDFGTRVFNFLDMLFERNVKVYLILQKMVEDENKNAYLHNWQIFFRNAQRSNPSFFIDKYGKEIKSRKIWFIRNVKCLFVPVNDHKFHINMFLNLDKHRITASDVNPDFVERSIYYYKFGLGQEIDPVRLIEPSNKGFVLDKFIEISREALALDINRSAKNRWVFIDEGSNQAPKD